MSVKYTMVFNALLQKPKNVTFESQEKGEKVYFILRRHPITNIGWLFFSLVLIVIPLAYLAFAHNLEDTFIIRLNPNYEFILIIMWYSLTMLYTFESFLMWYFSTYIITDKRVIDVDFTGLWGKRVSEAPLDNVEDATYQTRSFLNILFDYGDIFMQTAAEKTEFEFDSVPKPGMVHDTLTDLVEARKRRYR